MSGSPASTAAGTAADEFERHRAVLFTLAYELLGSAADADDIVQETWLRRQRVTGPVEHERALLCRIATRLALNARHDAARRREDYTGPWLPEPVATGRSVEDDVVLADAVSHATLVVLETLSPEERAAFVLVEVFAFSAADVADMLERSEDAVRQLVHRARERVREGRPHRRAGATTELWHALATAIRAGDVDATTRLLASDAVLVSDGGGLVSAALRPVTGAEHVARFLVGIAAMKPESTVELAVVNGALAAIARTSPSDPNVEFVMFLDVDGGAAQSPDARIRNVRIVRNPHKLGGIDAPRDLAR